MWVSDQHAVAIFPALVYKGKSIDGQENATSSVERQLQEGEKELFNDFLSNGKWNYVGTYKVCAAILLDGTSFDNMDLEVCLTLTFLPLSPITHDRFH